jgi:DNA-directed RNA polymerase specialized sigma24 family protein
MTVKQRLREYRDLTAYIHQLTLDIDYLYAKAIWAQPKPTDGVKVKTQPKHDPMADVAAHYLDEKALLEEKLAKHKLEHEVIVDAVDRLPARARRLIRLRYFDGMSWEGICVEMSYGWNAVHRIHRDALQALEVSLL